MRKIVLALQSLAALTLTACSDSTEDGTCVPAEDAKPDSEAATDVEGGASDSTTVFEANAAFAEQLAGANGVSPELAEAIVSGQPYASVTDLRAELLETLSEDEATTFLAG